MLTLGDLKIHWLSDGITWVDPGGPFGLVPRALWSRYMTPTADHLVPMSIGGLYVESGGRKIIIDTGHGTKIDAKSAANMRLERPHGGMLDGLARLGVRPQDIDLVIDTHLHGDHCGGNVYLDESGAPVPTFPNAEYVVQRREYEDAMRPNERTAATYFPINYEPLVNSGQMRLLDGDSVLAAGVYGHVTRGHTPGHMSIRFESAGKHGLFVCDMASYAVHFERLGWMTAYDVEPLETLESKRRWQQWAISQAALVIFPHDLERHAGYLNIDDNGKPKLTKVNLNFA